LQELLAELLAKRLPELLGVSMEPVA